MDLESATYEVSKYITHDALRVCTPSLSSTEDSATFESRRLSFDIETYPMVSNLDIGSQAILSFQRAARTVLTESTIFDGYKIYKSVKVN